ncbi:MAG: hypothetical protein BAJATHORv1_50209 [Candidatus Thorarchaeota archaeon]|nr:MAG: hypothetical protein BAJATHORv1_50209 [Candidatus Thorarchaeota archaeon]
MSKISCPHCAGNINIPEQSNTVVCSYCGTTVQVRTGEIIKESYLMKLQFNLEAIREKTFSWAAKQLGSPDDIEEKAEIIESELVYWPFWVVEVEAKGEYKGEQKIPNFGDSAGLTKMGWKTVSEAGKFNMEEDIFVPATKDIPEQLETYMIPTKRKEYFDKDLVLETRGNLQPIQVERETAIIDAKKMMDKILRAEAYEEVDEIKEFDVDLSIPAVFLVHIPIWYIRYKYSVRTYHAMIDGASGRIVTLSFPRKIAFRAMVFTGGILHLVVGGGIALVLVYLGIIVFGNIIFPTLFGATFGLGMLAFALQFFRKAVTLGEEEEIAS